MHLYKPSLSFSSRNVRLSKGFFEGRTSTGSEAFSLFTSPDDIKFILPSFFTLVETI